MNIDRLATLCLFYEAALVYFTPEVVQVGDSLSKTEAVP